jgi:hypothetical protein
MEVELMARILPLMVVGAAVTLVAPARDCPVWTDTGKRSVTLRYEFRRGPK